MDLEKKDITLRHELILINSRHITYEALCLLLKSEKPRKLYPRKQETTDGFHAYAWNGLSTSVFKVFPSTFTFGRGHTVPRFIISFYALRSWEATLFHNYVKKFFCFDRVIMFGQ